MFKRFDYFSILSFDIISAALKSDPQIFLCIPESAVSAAVNPNGIKTWN